MKIFIMNIYNANGKLHNTYENNLNINNTNQIYTKHLTIK